MYDYTILHFYVRIVLVPLLMFVSFFVYALDFMLIRVKLLFSFDIGRIILVLDKVDKSNNVKIAESDDYVQ